jgi:probable rRNA maturation factor
MSPDDSPLLFHHPSRSVRRGPLRLFFAELVKKAAHGRSITCLITTDREIRSLNHRFRGRRYPTDVLSFPSAETDGAGEIAISLDRAREQAADYGHSLDEELRILMLHGVLHLAGLDHETDSGEMASEEARWRKRFKLPSSLIERANA